MGLLISTRARSQAEAFQMAFGTMLPTIFLSGYIFPINNMPLQFQMVSKIIPTTYFIDVTRGVILRGASLAELWTNGAVLLLMALVAVGLAARQFHRQLT
jgi:ABC-2 type transport system permease protein